MRGLRKMKPVETNIKFAGDEGYFLFEERSELKADFYLKNELCERMIQTYSKEENLIRVELDTSFTPKDIYKPE